VKRKGAASIRASKTFEWYDNNEAQLRASRTSLSSQGHLSRKDLKKVGKLGSGAFSVVELYQHKRTQNLYAVKAINKAAIERHGLEESVMREKNLMMMVDSPFVIRLRETYNSAAKVFFAMEAALGGELFEVYTNKRLSGSEPHAKFYVASVLLALEHLHEHRIIYRDLKPENVVLKADGYAILMDLGLSKYVIGRTYTMCGTAEYFAPEVVALGGYTRAVDWWSLGIFAFELLIGHTPFENASQIKLFQSIAEGINDEFFPESCPDRAKSFINGLLKVDPADRLPMRMGKCRNLTEHSWYDGFDLDALNGQSLTPPYMPTVNASKLLAKRVEQDRMFSTEYDDKDSPGWDRGFATCCA